MLSLSIQQTVHIKQLKVELITQKIWEVIEVSWIF